LFFPPEVRCIGEDCRQAELAHVVDGGNHPGRMTDNLVGGIDGDLTGHDTVLQALGEFARHRRTRYQ
jgi:hypothetical protein